MLFRQIIALYPSSDIEIPLGENGEVFKSKNVVHISTTAVYSVYTYQLQMLYNDPVCVGTKVTSRFRFPVCGQAMILLNVSCMAAY